MLVIDQNERDMILRTIDVARTSLLAAKDQAGQSAKALSFLTELYFNFRPLETADQIRRFRDHLATIMARPDFGQIELLNFKYDSVIGGMRGAYQPGTAESSESIGNLLAFLAAAVDSWIDTVAAKDSVGQFQKIIPLEKTGPFYYSVKDRHLIVSCRPAGATIEGALAKAKTALLEQGERLIVDLEGSNSQPYLRAALEAVQAKLATENDIVQLGLLNISFEAAVSGAAEELNSVLANVLQTHTVGIQHYLAQFPEWVDFSDAAAVLELTHEDVDHLANVADELADALEIDEQVDDEVPRTLRFVSELRHHPGKQLKRAGLFILRTIENATITAFRSSSVFASTATCTALKGAAVLIGSAFAVAIALIIIHNSAVFVASLDAAWLKAASEALIQEEQKALTGLKKD
ncbi:hypothetical protein [Rhizobium rhizogenes]|uniref:hypothetical protein n=1 Tax=Rhizobium rhizogenes TaxID=359 RepID=UPI000645663B|nr:hypothetical protein [Rhizobium rhizogenes]